MLALTPDGRRVRFVTHGGIDDADVTAPAEAIVAAAR